MTVAMAVMTILMGSLASAILVASKSIEPPSSTVDSNRQAAEAANQITEDAAYAINFTERTRKSITFQVPDRDGDNMPETIRYAWSGTSGNPLTYEYNGGSAVTMLEDVRQFDLSYLLTTTGPPPGACCLPDGSCVLIPKTECEATTDTIYEGDGSTCTKCPVESSEQVLISRDWSKAGDIQNYLVKDNAFCSEYFKPMLPANTLWWKITRVQVKIKRNGTHKGILNIGITNADAGNKPVSAAPLASVSFDALTMPTTYYWQECLLTLAKLDTSKGYCLVASTVSTDDPAHVAFDGKGTSMDMAWSIWNGSAWSVPVTNKAMEFYVFGTITTQP